MEELALRGRRQGRRDVVRRRLAPQDIGDILGGLRSIYDDVQPRDRQGRPRRRPSRPRKRARRPRRVRERPARRGEAGKKFTPQDADTLGTRGAGRAARRSPARSRRPPAKLGIELERASQCVERSSLASRTCSPLAGAVARTPASAPWQAATRVARRASPTPQALILGSPAAGCGRRRAGAARVPRRRCAGSLRGGAGRAAAALRRGARARAQPRRAPTTTTGLARRAAAWTAPPLGGALRGDARGDGARRRRGGAPLAAAARVPRRHALHAPGRRRDARDRAARARQARARPRPRPRSPRTCSTPTRRACASCSSDAAPARERASPSRAAEAAARPRATSTILAPRYARTAAPPRRPRRRAAFAALARRPRAGRTRGRRDARARDRPRSRASPPRRSPPRRPRAARSSCCASSRSCRSSTAAASSDGRVTRTSRSRRRSRSATAPPRRSPTSRPARRARPGAHRSVADGARPSSATSLDGARASRRGVAEPDEVDGARPRRVEDLPTRDCPAGLEGADRRGRLRPDRADARPHGGRGRRRPVPRRPSRRGSRPTRSSSSAPSGAWRLDPGLAPDIEGLIWYGAGGQRRPGRADRQARGAAARSRETPRSRSTARSSDAAATLGDGASAPRWSPTRRSSSSARASRPC